LFTVDASALKSGSAHTFIVKNLHRLAKPDEPQVRNTYIRILSPKRVFPSEFLK